MEFWEKYNFSVSYRIKYGEVKAVSGHFIGPQGEREGKIN